MTVPAGRLGRLERRPRDLVSEGAAHDAQGVVVRSIAEVLV
jgi:hypothetical protein